MKYCAFYRQFRTRFLKRKKNYKSSRNWLRKKMKYFVHIFSIQPQLNAMLDYAPRIHVSFRFMPGILKVCTNEFEIIRYHFAV